MPDRSAGPIARAKLAKFKRILLTDLDTLENQIKCKEGQASPRKCPMCYLHQNSRIGRTDGLGISWHQHSDGKYYAYEEGKFPEWLR